MNYLDQVRPTYIENWPSELQRLSIAQVHIPLTLDEARALGSNIMEFGELFAPEPQDITSIIRKVWAAAGKFPQGAFVRLGSRSPKDSWGWLRSPGPILGTDPFPLRYLLDCSERISDDLALALKHNYAPSLFVRQWLNIEPWSEFRCFVKQGRLVGVSQYLYREHFPQIQLHHSLLDWGICQFWHSYRRWIAGTQLVDSIFDVVARVRQKDNERSIEVTLLEINPFGEFTDPCLFSWLQGGDMNHTFRWVGKDGKTIESKLDLYRGCFGLEENEEEKTFSFAG